LRGGTGVKTSRLSFDLPDDLVAQTPAEAREAAGLLVLDRATGLLTDAFVRDLPGLVKPGTLIVLNDTRVRKARLFAERRGGGRVEILLLERKGSDVWSAIVGRSRQMKPGSSFLLPEGVSAHVMDGEGESRYVRFMPAIDDPYLERHGHVPLPPYIRRHDTPVDAERYQTVYARHIGSAAAPTAGLHFTPMLIAALEEAGAEIAYVTLHVGLGTFLPIRTEDVEDNPMHEEAYAITPRTAESVEKAVSEGRPVLAVGTTVVRTLESAWHDGRLAQGEGRTRIFIYPGYRFKVVGKLFTNFHTPGSSLLALVCAFAGTDLVLETYRRAVEKRYRFFSYGDAMLIQ
jgi:S-adenosylmethionine:tRNA ribosyltransferase-isomerase